MDQYATSGPGHDDAHGEETGHEQGRSDEVHVEPGPKGPGSAEGTGAGKAGGLPGQGFSAELPEDEADDTVRGSEPYDDTQPRTEPYEERLDDDV
ncbi:hypothetical protein G1H11_01765 [Phytoactinopolyspora alkaliphila]|uniref:DUF5709 domain-containing protein n=1 Tax=Phytoactinopolyspora alkaliphila TaxID=1783498 RepID=A0A6N9YGE2_9ACTN|nr:hypothetical protein [Phytoactinopolyspora alkaliphila]NED94032.1 hypothetical protein [Phytoactinopolyspora alkaliphila]